MKTLTCRSATLFASVLVLSTSTAQAALIDWVTVANLGNAGDEAVDHQNMPVFQIQPVVT